MSNVSEWAVTAAGNEAAAPPHGWPEGQSPGSVNDCAREMMAATSRWFRDMDGSLITGGTSTAYTLTTNNVLADINDISIIVAKAHVANTGPATLNVGSLGTKAIRKGHKVPLVAGEIQINQRMLLIYNPATDFFELLNPAGSAGGMILIEEVIVGAPTLNINIPLNDQFDAYRMVLKNVRPVTNGADIYMRISSDGGTTYEQTNYIRMHRSQVSNAPTVLNLDGSDDAVFGYVGLSIGNVTVHDSAGLHGTIDFVRTPWFSATCDVNYKDAGGNHVYFTSSIRRQSLANAVRLSVSDGDIGVGTVRCYALFNG